jgi:hypothetical protein
MLSLCPGLLITQLPGHSRAVSLRKEIYDRFLTKPPTCDKIVLEFDTLFSLLCFGWSGYPLRASLSFVWSS